MLRKLIRFIRKYIRPLFPQWLVNHLFHLPKAYLAARMYGNPGKDLTIIGVTGTDGKTTTTTLIYHILKTAGAKAAMISTVEARIGRDRIDTGFHVTAPDPLALQKLLRRIRSLKYRYVVLEVTSHGLDQFRTYPLRPEIAVLTNITHEHLDYHQTFEKYVAAKLKLFKHAHHAVMNKDLPIFTDLNARLPGVLFSTYSINADSQLKPINVKYLKGRTKFSLGNIHYELPLTGQYNLYNALAAISTTLILGISPSDIKRALATFAGIKGRLEEIPNKRGLHIYVDFAHTPNALREVLTNLASQKPKGAKLIVVFGAAGERDVSKRPLMGRVAGELADAIMLTSEDPRLENPLEIAQAIKSGIPDTYTGKIKLEIDRSKAIAYAINNLAKSGDYVVICGKGHELSMNLDGVTETPWSDQETVNQVLSKML